MANIGLVGCARIIVEKMANVSSNERTLVLTDPNYLSRRLPDLLFESCLACGAESVKLTTTPTRAIPLGHPDYFTTPRGISKLAKITADAADVVFTCTRVPMEVKLDLIGKGKKVVQIYGVNDEMVLRLTPVDLGLMERRVSKLLRILPEIEKAHVTSPEGTDLTFSLKGCILPVAQFDGICHPGEYDAMPGGMVNTLPVPGTGNGVIVLDGSMRGWGLIRTPIRITVKDGKFAKIEGAPEAIWLDKSIKKALAEGDQNANHWAEFLMGMNPNAVIAGYEETGDQPLLFEDERCLGTVNIGWGTDTHLSGQARGKFHGDGIIRNPTVTLDGVAFIKDGIPTKELQ